MPTAGPILAEYLDVAELMLMVEKAVGGGDRDAMETWFRRTMEADGNNREACFLKLDWLDPKWHGSDEEMLALGRDCLATKNWQAGITLLAAEAHLRIFDRLVEKARQEYMTAPEAWAVISPAFEEYLKHFPSNDLERSKYAMLCRLAARYPEAHARFQILGDRLMAWSSFPRYLLEELKRMRADVARVVAARPAGPEKP
jgi:hypothetical protein